MGLIYRFAACHGNHLVACIEIYRIREIPCALSRLIGTLVGHLCSKFTKLCAFHPTKYPLVFSILEKLWFVPASASALHAWSMALAIRFSKGHFI